MKVTFDIRGKIKGKGRPRFARMGNFVKTYTDKDTLSYENMIKFAFLQAKNEKGCDWDYPEQGAPIGVVITCKFAFPASMSKKKRDAAYWVTKKPDCDNIIKIILDALNKVAFPDDSQVSEVVVRKIYNSEESVMVELFTQETDGCNG